MSKEEVLKMIATQDTFALRIRAAELLTADGDTQGAATHYIRALELFPYVTGPGNPYESLAKLLEQKGDQAQAAKVLEGLDRERRKQSRSVEDRRAFAACAGRTPTGARCFAGELLHQSFRLQAAHAGR